MGYLCKGKLDDGQTFRVRFPAAPHFMAALAGLSKALTEHLKEKAGKVVECRLTTEDDAGGFVLRRPRPKKAK
jgi:hypothetical protein